MTFEEWFDKDDANYVEDLARAAWGYQQNHIEKLEWDLGDVENALNNMKQINKHLRKNIADTQEKLDIERNRTEELEEQVEWHKRRAEGWRSIAVLEENLK